MKAVLEYNDHIKLSNIGTFLLTVLRFFFSANKINHYSSLRWSSDIGSRTL